MKTHMPFVTYPGEFQFRGFNMNDYQDSNSSYIDGIDLQPAQSYLYLYQLFI